MVKKETCYKRKQKHHTSNNILDYTMYMLVEAEIHQSIYQISYVPIIIEWNQKNIQFSFIFLGHFVTDSSKSECINKSSGWRDVVVAT